MRADEPIVEDRYVDINYMQFSQSPLLILLIRLFGIMTWPLVIPLALMSKLSDLIFMSCSQFVSMIPLVIGNIVRYEFYRWTLTSCGRNVHIGFGTVFFYRDIEIGDNVLIGMYNTIHHCNIGSYVLIAEGCRLLSGSAYHNYSRTDIPIALQGGKLKRIKVEDDVWIGVNAIIMECVGEGCIVGANAVITKNIEPYSIVVGNPARVIRKRKT